MASKSLLNLVYLSFLSLSVSLPDHQTSAANRGRFLPEDNHGDGVPLRGGLCSTAITKHGYKCQEFQVTTGDGYILTVQRIPEGRAGGSGGRRPPVLLQHGVLMDGMAWVVGPPKDSLAIILADKGFDVWISNVRGTRFSRRHIKLDPSNPEYWNWTWDDLVAHDLRSVLAFILKKTGSKIHFVGHSMGTLMALASLSEGRLKNVKSAALLCPIAYLNNMKTAIITVAARAFLGEIGTIFGLAEFNPKGEDEAVFFESLCSFLKLDCNDLRMTAMTGKNCCLDETTLNNFIKKEPQSTSTKNLVHFSQTIRDGILSKYDYGNVLENMHHYGQLRPPVYNLSRIPHSFPLFISYGGEDSLSDVKDVEKLLDDLKLHQKQKLKVHFIKNYAHLDFILGVNAKDVLYNHIVDFLTRYDNK